jgi:hypothetical protein
MASWDLTSLSFQNSLRQAVQLPASNPGIGLVKPANNFTISLWTKSTTADLDSSGSELVSGGDHYILRFGKPTGASAGNWSLEFNKYVFADDLVPPRNVYAQCWHLAAFAAGAPPFMDGNWHHIVAIANSSAPGTALYLDGVSLTCDVFNNNFYATRDVVYTGLGTDFWVARHGNPAASSNPNYDFQGTIDDVRFYNRVLSLAEIRALAQGTQLP